MLPSAAVSPEAKLNTAQTEDMELLALFADVLVPEVAAKPKAPPNVANPLEKKRPAATAIEEHVPMKRVRKLEEKPTCTSWASRLRRAFAEHLQARGAQKRPLVVESSSSGMSTHTVALKDCIEPPC